MQYVPIGTFSPLFSQFGEEMNACYRFIYRNGSQKRRTAEIDWTSHTLPLRDLENDQLITIDLNTGIAL